MTVELAVVPHEATHLLVIGTALRKPAGILSAYFKSLEWQVCPPQVHRVYCFVDDGLDEEALALAKGFVERHGGVLAKGGDLTPDFTDQGPTHGWTEPAMQRVGRHKDQILAFAREHRAEAVWFADADLIMEPMTLSSLWSVPELIVAACYWTRWTHVPEGSPPIHAGPQVWLSGAYGLQGHGMDEWEFRRRLIDRQVTQVFGQGACTLIRRDALMKGVSFAPWPGNTMPGIGQGEDRHFCMRAEAMHLKMVVDPWPDIFHVYHRPADESRIQEWLDRFEGRRSWIDLGSLDIPPSIGDLVSLDLTALEPVNTAQGWMNAQAQQVRGRLGGVFGPQHGRLHPELEDAVLGMTRGETKIVPVHFDLGYPFPPFRGQRRLIRVTLLDHKPHGFAPVIEDEVLVNRAGSHLDTTKYPPETLDLMREVHAA